MIECCKENKIKKHKKITYIRHEPIITTQKPKLQNPSTNPKPIYINLNQMKKQKTKNLNYRALNPKKVSNTKPLTYFQLKKNRSKFICILGWRIKGAMFFCHLQNKSRQHVHQILNRAFIF